MFSKILATLRRPIKNPLNGISSLLLTVSEFNLFRVVHTLSMWRKADFVFSPIGTKG